MVFRSSKKIATGIPFGVGTVYKTSGFVETDMVEVYYEYQDLEGL